MSARLALALLCCWLAASLPARAADYVAVPGGPFRSALAPDGGTVAVKPFRLRARPVTNGEYLRFARAHPAWRRGTVPALYAKAGYLADWRGADELGDVPADAPVTRVSWHAARAYCRSEGARLPLWYEWEMAAAADAGRRDARDDPQWRARILQWYAQPAGRRLAPAGREPNVWGVSDLHGSIYEWVEDFNGLFVTSDSRAQGEQRTLATCGAAALSLGDRENYAILMRIAMLAALDAADTVGTVGFRCARDETEGRP
ncbi:formylglycine-generating enzyme family protein [Chromobacterium violaceum]|uniref:Sulfatase-modifying factor enzyme-like domain-containing protein n=1 Tax=Chromobacterium violaceum TaxID=536 RepID=A0A202B3F6_CHRVL|nr:formylglycine-generating enzyme family protein [Chromobacterium violaceum]OVE46107.1 hypothetical protein CBW21_20155 [Chromobacterium violaceum]